MKTFKVGLIYKVLCVPNGKVYVGKTTRTKAKRWAEHVAAAFAGAQGILHRAIRKYGVDAFKVRKLRSATEPILDAMESHYIARYDSYKHGYNMTLGGDGVSMTPAMRRRISRSLRKFYVQNPEAALAHSLRMLGHHQSARTIAMRNKSLKGQLRSDVLCELMSLRASERPSRTDEHRSNMRYAQQARFSDPIAHKRRSDEQSLKWQDDKYRAQMVAAHTGTKLPPWSDERRVKVQATWAAKKLVKA